EMYVQPTMIQALDIDHDLAMVRRFVDAGEAGHAAYRVHGFTIGSGSRNCSSCRRLYMPPWLISSSCAPVSVTRPRSSTTILSARRIVERRCAITITVRWVMRFC